MQCKEVEVVLEHEGWTPLPEAARVHVAGCAACQNLVEDLTSIVATAHLFPAEVQPPAKVRPAYAPKLEEEGSIKPAAAERGSWLQGFSDLFPSRVLATAAVGL